MSIDREFDYIIPNKFADIVLPGSRVLVPFGRGNRHKEGIAIEICNQSLYSDLKEISSVVDRVLTGEMVELVKYMKDRSFCGYYDAVKAMLPLALRLKYKEIYSVGDISKKTYNNLERKILEYIAKNKKCSYDSLINKFGADIIDLIEPLKENGSIIVNKTISKKANDAFLKCASLKVSANEAADYINSRGNKKHQKVLDILLSGDSVPVNELCYLAGVSTSVVSTLEKYGIIEVKNIEVFRSPYKNKFHRNEKEFKEIILNDEQLNAFNGLYELYEKDSAEVALLYGITGSGKTMIYMKLIDSVLSINGNVILLVPEISLTPQITDRFYERYGDKVAVMHSAMSMGERYDEWKRIKNGEVNIVIGTRSAIFAPFERIDLIIIDEEQESTYKSENSPRYHARDIAKFRAYKHSALLLLCSATPSVESYAYALSGKYHLFEVEKRFGESKLPSVHIIDLKEELKSGNRLIIGDFLRKEIEKNLKNGEQTILFLNRRGYNTFIGCKCCGYVMTCPNCSISMTYHSSNNLMMCHYCGYSQEPVSVCPSCREPGIRFLGTGTQKLEDEIHKLFPEAKIVRMDLDTTNYKMSHEKILGDFAKGNYDIMIGTQMVTKGLDIPNVSLVGVILADSMLFADDFRANERTFAMLTQVVGRAGRSHKPGRAVIQTYNPDNNILKLSKNQDYKAFFNEEILFRKMMKYPPFCDIYQIIFSGADEESVKNAAFTICEELKKQLISIQRKNVILYNPSSSAIFKINNKYRYKIIMKCKDDSVLRNILKELQISFYKEKAMKDISMIIDLNPQIIL